MRHKRLRVAGKFWVTYGETGVATTVDFTSWADAAHFMKYLVDGGSTIKGVGKIIR